MKDLIDNKGKFKASNVFMIPQSKIFYWLMLKHSIKKEWIQKIKNETSACVTPERMYLPLKEGNLELCKLSSKSVYDTFVKNIQEILTGRLTFEKMVETDVYWKCVYKTLYNTSIDTRLRAF